MVLSATWFRDKAEWSVYSLLVYILNYVLRMIYSLLYSAGLVFARFTVGQLGFLLPGIDLFAVGGWSMVDGQVNELYLVEGTEAVLYT